MFGGDFNLPEINWTDHTVTDSQYPHRVSKTFLDIAKDLNLEQVVNFPRRLQNTLDLVFMSHPSFKIRYKPLPPIGLKSDHDMVLLDTSILPVRNRLPRQRIYIWKKANVDGIRSHFQAFADRFCTTSAQSVEDMWTTFKSAISSAVSQHAPSKMSSPRQAHPWVDTRLRRHMRRKQRAHWKAKKSGRDKDWKRYKKLQKEIQSSTRRAGKDFFHNFISGNLKQDPKRFFSDVKKQKAKLCGCVLLG